MDFCLRVHLGSDVIIGTSCMTLSLSKVGTKSWCSSIDVKAYA